MPYLLSSEKNLVFLTPVEGTPLDRVIELMAGAPEVEVSDELGDFLKTHSAGVRVTKKIEAVKLLDPDIDFPFSHQE